MTVNEMRVVLCEKYNGVCRGVRIRDMKDSQVRAIYKSLMSRKESDSYVCIVDTSPKIIRKDGRVYILKDNGRFEEIEDDYED